MLTQLVMGLNRLANGLGAILFAPIGWLPGWLSAGLIGAVTGVLMLVVFKYTSNQQAIKRTRDQIRANLLALSLFRANLPVSLFCQWRLVGGALKLLCHSLVPMIVMTPPMLLLLAQMALWYQARPLLIGEESVVTVRFRSGASEAISSFQLVPSEATSVVTGPVRVPSKDIVCWNITPKTNGLHAMTFAVGSQSFEKELVVGAGYRPASLKRPSSDWSEVLLHPRESPFGADSTVQSIEVTYPERDSFIMGTNNWIVYWFLVSMIAAFAAKPFLNVNL